MKPPRRFLVIASLMLGVLIFRTDVSRLLFYVWSSVNGGTIPGGEQFAPVLHSMSDAKANNSAANLMETIAFALLGIWFSGFLLFLPGRLLSSKEEDGEPT